MEKYVRKLLHAGDGLYEEADVGEEKKAVRVFGRQADRFGETLSGIVLAEGEQVLYS